MKPVPASDLLDRPCEVVPSTHEIPNNAEEDNGPKYKDTPIHRIGRDGSDLWPERPEKQEGAVNTCEEVVDHAERFRDTPWPP